MFTGSIDARYLITGSTLNNRQHYRSKITWTVIETHQRYFTTTCNLYPSISNSATIDCTLPIYLMSNPDDDALVHEDINTMSPTMYNRVHLDLDQDRPKGTGLRIRNSFDYTVKDVRQRISDSTGSVNNRWRGCRSSIQAFPNKAKSYISTTVSFYRENPTILRKEILSGVTVSILQVPESIAFSYVAGLQSMYGLFATVWLGTMTALFGGKPGMISGAAGALAVVIADLTDVRGPLKNLSSELKVEHLLMTVIFVGVIQIAFGLMGLARFVTLIPTYVCECMHLFIHVIHIHMCEYMNLCMHEYLNLNQSEHSWIPHILGQL